MIKKHNYLGECISDAGEFGLMVIEDTNVIRGYGTYYLEISKSGYKTEIKRVEVKDGQVRFCLGVVLKPTNNWYMAWWIVDTLFCLWFGNCGIEAENVEVFYDGYGGDKIYYLL